jgi:putative endonuclease
VHFADHRCYCIYIVTNRSKTLYVGVTNNLRRRVWEHKFGDGSEFCKRYKIDRLVYYESFDDVRTRLTARSGSRGGSGLGKFS